MEETQSHAILELGWLSLRRNDFGDAYAVALEILARDPDDLDALLLAGLAALRIPEPQAAKDAAFRRIELSPYDARSHVLLALFYHELGEDPVAAEGAFREAIRLEPEDPENYAFLGRFLSTRGRNREGIATARKGLKLDPDNLLVLSALQSLYRLAEEKELSEEFGARALEVAPEESSNYLEAGFRLLEGRNNSEARTNFLEALRLQPDDGGTFLAIAHEKVRQHPFFRDGWFLPVNATSLTGAIATPLVWWGLSLLWHPFFWLAVASVILLILSYSYTGAFHFFRWVCLRRLKAGKL